MKKIDLHTHSTFSDGTFTPTELILHAKNKNLDAISITDHDTIDGLDEGFDASIKYNVELITGVEFTCFISGIEVHILGYMFDKNSIELKNEIKKIAKSRKERNDEMISRFKKIGIHLTYDDLLCNTNGNIVTRSQFAISLVNKGYAKTKNEAFKKFLISGCPTYIKRENITANISVSLIKKAGGIAILAHPLRYRQPIEKLKNIIDLLIPYGLDGIEVIYPKLTKNQIKEVENICYNKNLIITGGSDFHGLAKEDIELGTGCNNDILVPYDILDKMKQLKINSKK